LRGNLRDQRKFLLSNSDLHKETCGVFATELRRLRG